MPAPGRALGCCRGWFGGATEEGLDRACRSSVVLVEGRELEAAAARAAPRFLGRSAGHRSLGGRRRLARRLGRKGLERRGPRLGRQLRDRSRLDFRHSLCRRPGLRGRRWLRGRQRRRLNGRLVLDPGRMLYRCHRLGCLRPRLAPIDRGDQRLSGGWTAGWCGEAGWCHEGSPRRSRSGRKRRRHVWHSALIPSSDLPSLYSGLTAQSGRGRGPSPQHQSRLQQHRQVEQDDEGENREQRVAGHATPGGGRREDGDDCRQTAILGRTAEPWPAWLRRARPLLQLRGQLSLARSARARLRKRP